jgi:hypothetical protein
MKGPEAVNIILSGIIASASNFLKPQAIFLFLPP